MSVPVCITCQWYRKCVGQSGHRCYAIFDVVTGEATPMDCYEARGDQLLCGREGKLYEAVT